jgi:uncharacterized protein YbaA (DUF1428 family)
MARYADGFVLLVPRRKLDAYRRISQKAGKVWKEHGALEYIETVGDDLKMKWGRPFPAMVKPRAGEAIVFSWIVFKSKRDRDRVNAKVMKDPRLAEQMDPKAMPFDLKRMSYGGFEVLVDM